MNYIIVGSNGRRSMEEIIKTLDRSLLLIKKNDGGWVSVSNSGRRTPLKTLPVFTASDVIIKWGNSIEIKPNGAVVYNNPGAVSKASNKGLFRTIMHQKGIDIPTIITKKDLPIGERVVLRPLHHRAGQNFHLVTSLGDLARCEAKYGRDGYYMSKIYPKQREVRVHCCLGKVLLIKEKPAPADKKEVAWNFAINEQAWSTIDRKDYDPALCKIALDAMEAIGLDIGAVDVMFDPMDKKLPRYVICEINTAPSLTEYLVEKYQSLFMLLFAKKERIEKWDYSKFTKGESFSWKNQQMLKL